MKSIGICGDSRSTARASFSFFASASTVRRSPLARLPIWSWFCTKATNAWGGNPSVFFAAHAIEVAGIVALKDEPFRQRAAELGDRVDREIAVIALAFAGQQHVPAMVDVRRPHWAIVGDSLAVAVAGQQMRLVGLVFEHQMDMPGGEFFADALGELVEEMLLAVVENGMNGVEA